MSRLTLSIAFLLSFGAQAPASPYCMSTADGIQRMPRSGQGACPTGFFGSGPCCEAFRRSTPAAYPKIEGAACPSGTYRSGGYCVRFR